MFKVLIAEDEPPIMRMIKSTLETVDSDFKVTECCINGKNAVEKLKNEDFDIVITDIKMPIMNGLEATRIIREEGASLPIIMQTAYAFSSDRENAMQAGASEVLVKPITVSALRGCLSSYFPEIKW